MLEAAVVVHTTAVHLGLAALAVEEMLEQQVILLQMLEHRVQLILVVAAVHHLLGLMVSPKRLAALAAQA
jgi:hypothetical protein